MDIEILYFINQFAGNSELLDRFLLFISTNHLFKGGVFVILIWILWFQKGSKKVNRPLILLNLFGCFVTLFLARVLALLLPYRLRPIHNPDLDISFPIGLSRTYAEGMSSFPSDHAALFFALGTGIYFVSRKLGVISLIYAFLIICLPRIYLGLHYPGDILAGATLGIVVVLATNKFSHANKITRPVVNFKKGYPAIFYGLFFLLTYQIADMFESVRSILSFTYSLLVH